MLKGENLIVARKIDNLQDGSRRYFIGQFETNWREKDLFKLES